MRRLVLLIQSRLQGRQRERSSGQHRVQYDVDGHEEFGISKLKESDRVGYLGLLEVGDGGPVLVLLQQALREQKEFGRMRLRLRLGKATARVRELRIGSRWWQCYLRVVEAAEGEEEAARVVDLRHQQRADACALLGADPPQAFEGGAAPGGDRHAQAGEQTGFGGVAGLERRRLDVGTRVGERVVVARQRHAHFRVDLRGATAGCTSAVRPPGDQAVAEVLEHARRLGVALARRGHVRFGIVAQQHASFYDRPHRLWNETCV